MSLGRWQGKEMATGACGGAPTPGMKGGVGLHAGIAEMINSWCLCGNGLPTEHQLVVRRWAGRTVIPSPSETRCGSRLSLTQSSGWGLRAQVRKHVGEEVCNGRSSLRSVAWSEWPLSPQKPPPLGSWKFHRKSQTDVQTLPWLFCDLEISETCKTGTVTPTLWRCFKA